MRDELKLVRGAVATKDLIPVLTHFHFYGGRVQGGNGAMCIDSPIDCGYDEPFTVPAKPFLAAVDACGGAPRVKPTENGRLSVSKGRFRALLPLSPPGEYPLVEPAGEPLNVPVGSLQRLKALLPFVSEDASRPWSRGVLLRDGKAYATNNVVLASADVDWASEVTNIPGESLVELVRIGRAVDRVIHGDGDMTFGMGDAWLHTRLFDLGWPDVDALLQGGAEMHELPPDLLQNIELVVPFSTDASFATVVLHEDRVVCGDAVVEMSLPWVQAPMSVAAKPLMEVLKAATHMSYNETVVHWKGEAVRGVMALRR